MKNFISERLLEERLRLGMNKGDMARAGGVANSSYTNYEEARRSPDGDFLASIASAGVDIQYILTGIRSGNAPASAVVLTPEEQVLLERYRDSPKELKKAALRVLLAGEQEKTSRAKFVVHGDVAQQIEVKNGSRIENINVDMGKN